MIIKSVSACMQRRSQGHHSMPHYPALGASFRRMTGNNHTHDAQICDRYLAGIACPVPRLPAMLSQ